MAKIDCDHDGIVNTRLCKYKIRLGQIELLLSGPSLQVRLLFCGEELSINETMRMVTIKHNRVDYRDSQTRFEMIGDDGTPRTKNSLGSFYLIYHYINKSSEYRD